ncbi:hypothetical protein JG687_00008111, partial [Phytophthora cactorum]
QVLVQELFTLRLALLQSRLRLTVRLCSVVLLPAVVAILFAAGIGAVSTFKATSHVTPQWDRSLSFNAKDAPVNRLLKIASTTDEDNEERAFSGLALAKKLAAR